MAANGKYEKDFEEEIEYIEVEEDAEDEEVAEEAPEEEQPEAVAAPTEGKQKKKGKKSTGALVAIIAAAVLLIGVTVGLAVTGVFSGEKQSAGVVERKLKDGIVLKVDGEEVTEEEFKVWLNYAAGSMQNSYGMVDDWDEVIGGETTFKDLLLTSTLSSIIQSKTVRTKCGEYGITEESIEEKFNSYMDSLYVNAGGKDSYEKQLADGGMNLEFAENVIKTNMMKAELQAATTGKDTTDEAIEEKANEDYMAAMHILVAFSDEMTEEKALAKAQNILTQIVTYSGDDLYSYFAELAMKETDDPGILSFPEGYIFGEGEMVPEFEAAVKALEVGAISEPIKTSYGYHIILRIPLDLDATPMRYASNGYTTPLRDIVKSSIFTSLLSSWCDEVKTEVIVGFYDYDVNSVLNG